MLDTGITTITVVLSAILSALASAVAVSLILGKYQQKIDSNHIQRRIES